MKALRSIFAACLFGSGLAGCATSPLQGAHPRPLAAAEPVVVEDAVEHAKLARHFSRNAPAQGWQLLTTSRELMRGDGRGFEGAVYKKDGRYAVVFYGINDRKDIAPALRAGFFGVPRKQLAQAHEFTRLAADAYGILPQNLDVVGHSLGGYLAKAVAMQAGAESVWTFNSPGFKKRDPRRIEKLFGKEEEIFNVTLTPQVRTLNSSYDLVGMWGRQAGTVYEVETPRAHHNIEQVIAAAEGREIEATSAQKAGIVRRGLDRLARAEIVRKGLAARFRPKNSQ